LELSIEENENGRGSALPFFLAWRARHGERVWPDPSPTEP
jgi:hypothetical protein